MSRDQVARVLILGASGQVGHALQQSTPPATTLFTPSSSEVDLRTTDSLRAAIRDCAPDVILNCAAFTRVDDAQSHSDTARAINAEAPQIIVEEAVRFGARLIHISTDYVFDGTGSPPNAPGAPTAPLNVYGSTKLAGENAILSANANAVVLRTSWVHSGSGANFVATAVRALTKGGAMHVVDDQVSTPTRAAHLASAIWSLAHGNNVRGLMHFSDAGVASWYDVAHCVLETMEHVHAAGAGASVVPVDSGAFPRPARRPRVSLLDKHSSWSILGATPLHWRVGIIASTLELLHA